MAKNQDKEIGGKNTEIGGKNTTSISSCFNLINFMERFKKLRGDFRSRFHDFPMFDRGVGVELKIDNSHDLFLFL